MSKPIIGYWDIRGFAQPIRLLLAYVNVEFEDVAYTEFNAWFSKKFEMGFDFPNVSFSSLSCLETFLISVSGFFSCSRFHITLMVTLN